MSTNGPRGCNSNPLLSKPNSSFTRPALKAELCCIKSFRRLNSPSLMHAIKAERSLPKALSISLAMFSNSPPIRCTSPIGIRINSPRNPSPANCVICAKAYFTISEYSSFGSRNRSGNGILALNAFALKRAAIGSLISTIVSGGR